MTGEPHHIDLTPPGKDEVVLPLPREVSSRDWLRRAMIALALAVAMFLLLRFDVVLMRWRCEWIGEPDGLFRSLLGGFRESGEFFFVLVAFAIVATYDRRRWFIIGIVLFAELLASGGYNLGKEFVERDRPYQFIAENEEGEKENFDPEVTPWQSWHGLTTNNRSNDSRSFPSGHTSAAFAFAMTLAWFYPRLRWLLWTLAIGCGLSRFFDAQHWMSDCLAGAVIGYCAAWMALRPYAWVLPVIWWRRRVKKRQAAQRKADALTQRA